MVLEEMIPKCPVSAASFGKLYQYYQYRALDSLEFMMWTSPFLLQVDTTVSPGQIDVQKEEMESHISSVHSAMAKQDIFTPCRP